MGFPGFDRGDLVRQCLVLDRFAQPSRHLMSLQVKQPGVVIDAVRCAKVALDRGIGGPLLGPSAYFMKSPPEQHDDEMARDLVEKFIAGEIER